MVLKLAHSAIAMVCFWTLSCIHEDLGSLLMGLSPLDKLCQLWFTTWLTDEFGHGFCSLWSCVNIHIVTIYYNYVYVGIMLSWCYYCTEWFLAWEPLGFAVHWYNIRVTCSGPQRRRERGFEGFGRTPLSTQDLFWK